MNQKSFEMSSAARRRLDDYLDKVERLLMDSEVERQQRRSIVDDVQAQALEMLQQRTAQAEEADVETVLAKLDAPEDYARAAAESAAEPAGQPTEDNSPKQSASPPPAPVSTAQSDAPRLSPYALVAGLMLLPVLFFGPMALGGGMLLFGPRTGAFRLPLLGPWSLPSALLFLVLACGFGVAAISQIRNSQGRLYGLGLAVAAALLLPLLLLDGAMLAFSRMRPFYFSWSAAFSQTGILLCILALDCLIVWWVWRRLSQPPSTAQATGQLWQSNINIP